MNYLVGLLLISDGSRRGRLLHLTISETRDAIKGF
jgi:hypothetical protein